MHGNCIAQRKYFYCARPYFNSPCVSIIDSPYQDLLKIKKRQIIRVTEKNGEQEEVHSHDLYLATLVI